MKGTKKKMRCQRQKNSKLTVTVSKAAVAILCRLRNLVLVHKGEAGMCVSKPVDKTWIFKWKGKCNSEHVRMPSLLPSRPRSFIQVKTKFQMSSSKAHIVVWLDCTECKIIVTSGVYAARWVVLITETLCQKLFAQLFTTGCFVPWKRGWVQQGTKIKLHHFFCTCNLIPWYLECNSDMSTIQLFAYPLLQNSSFCTWCSMFSFKRNAKQKLCFCHFCPTD